MKHLVLVRHAKSSWSDPSVSDFYRKLNKRGKRDAPFMANKLAERKIVVDLIVSSPAARAKITAKTIAEALNYSKKAIVFDERIYSQSTAGLYRVLHEQGEKFNSIILVGHNYALTDFAEELTGKSLNNVPTSGMVGMTCDISTWQLLSEGSGQLLFFDYPKLHAELRKQSFNG